MLFLESSPLHLSPSVGHLLNIWAYLHLVLGNIWHMCTGHCCTTLYFIHCLVPSVKWSSSFPTWVVFLSSRPPLACPRGWVKVDKTPKYSVKHGRPLPCGRSLQCLLGNYGNNSTVGGEARGPRDDEVRPESLGRGAVAAEGGRRGQGEAGRALALLSHKPLLSHQRRPDVCGHSH